MKHIKLMADYDCHPLWNMTSENTETYLPTSFQYLKNCSHAF